jgi:hypothetical protein
MLRIEARKDANGKWHSGLLASADQWNDGFSQMYGYFEVRMKIPKGAWYLAGILAWRNPAPGNPARHEPGS